MKKQIINIRISEDLKTDLEFISEMNDESISNLSRKALEKYVEEYTNKEECELQEIEHKNNQNIDSFNFAQFVFSIYNKGFDLEEEDNKYIYAQLKFLLSQLKNTPHLREEFSNEFKKVKSDLELLMMYVNFYFIDVLKSEDPEITIEYYVFKEFLFNLKKGVNEYEEAIIYIKTLKDVR
jgi:hypothetical protein